MRIASYVNRNTVRTAALLIGAGFLLGAISAGHMLVTRMGTDRGYTPGHALIMATPIWVVWMLLIPVIVIAARWFPLQRETLRWAIPAHIAAGVLLALLHYTIHMVFMGLIGHATWAEPGHTFGEHYFPYMRYSLLPSFVIYVILLGGVVGLGYYRKYRERELLASQLEAQLSQAKLQALRMQLNPHFLFNAMNSIAMLVRRNANGEAVRMLAGLSDLLRYVLEDSPAEEVSVRDELEFLERYLEIERIRFQDRMRVKLDIAEETLDAYLPNLLLQPLVENAIRHGIARKVGSGTIELAARRLGDRLILQVRDDGPGLTNGPRVDGVGLANTRKRLEQIYNSEQSLDLRNAPNGGLVATVSLPFHTTPIRQEGVNAA
jgi:two-component system, LytTR family, sensor kinase